MDVLYAGFGDFWSCLTSGDISVLQKGQFQFSFFFVRISQMLQLLQRSSKVQLYNPVLFFLHPSNIAWSQFGLPQGRY